MVEESSSGLRRHYDSRRKILPSQSGGTTFPGQGESRIAPSCSISRNFRVASIAWSSPLAEPKPLEKYGSSNGESCATARGMTLVLRHNDKVPQDQGHTTRCIVSLQGAYTAED